MQYRDSSYKVFRNIVYNTFYWNYITNLLADPCGDSRNPCENGGTCTFNETFSVECHCPPEYDGTFCEIGKHLSLKRLRNVKYVLAFSKPWYFIYLERICIPPCENNGVCGADPRDPDELICFCPSGFFGDACEQRKSYW